ncbi:hypothetical protein TNCT_526881 [Trichonephila clavata]|uniref:Uncharacterized protein n=1 Tax=Trichonephila clavata TaxID=2740835 RepID=A0A8X6J8H8_TRICU|nr:hypothetical protein TNCT_526881 [Trichonephila clavata]
MINMVVTRCKEKRLLLKEKRKRATGGCMNPGVHPGFPSEEGEADSLEILVFDGGGEMSLAAVKSAEFMEEQGKCPDLQPLWDKAQGGVDKEFEIINGKLVRVAITRRGEEIRQLCVPLKFRFEINKLIHDEIGGGGASGSGENQR